MTRLFSTTALCAGTFLLAACGQDQESIPSATNTLLNHVPADTPYVVANLEPAPRAVINAYLTRFQPALNELQKTLEDLREEMNDANPDPEDERAFAIVKALMDELEGKYNAEGLASLGLSMETQSVFYGHGLLPVFRTRLQDAAQFRAFIARVEARSGQTLDEQMLDGRNYWAFGNAQEPMGLFMAILDEQLVISAAPRNDQTALRHLLGLELPTTSLNSDNTLAQLNKDKGYLPYGSGYMDTSRVMDELFSTDSTTRNLLAGLGDMDWDEIDPVCVSEARLIGSFVPRMVAGSTELTEDTIAMRYEMEMGHGVGQELARLVSDVAPASGHTALLATAALNLEFGGVREYLLEKSNLLSGFTFRCPQLEPLNDQITEMVAAMNQPVPPVLGNLKGFRAELADFNATNPQPDNVRGRFSLEMESPQMVIGMASMMIPGFDELGIEPGGEPVAVPQELASIRTPDMELYAVMSKDAIGLAVGSGQSEGLTEFLDDNTDPDGVFFSMEYDAEALAKLQQDRLQKSLTSLEAQDPESVERIRSLSSDYSEFMGRTRVELRFTDSGLVVDQRQSFD